MIIDTDVLIWYFKGNQAAEKLIRFISYDSRLTSSLCIMELIQGCRDKEELRDVKTFVKENISNIIHPDEKISEKAMLLLERYSLSDGLRTVDALIAASALINSTALATANYKHFKNISGIELVKFKP